MKRFFIMLLLVMSSYQMYPNNLAIHSSYSFKYINIGYKNKTSKILKLQRTIEINEPLVKNVYNLSLKQNL